MTIKVTWHESDHPRDRIGQFTDKDKPVVRVTFKGGQGSGNYGHAGRPGEVGGSAPGKSDLPEQWQTTHHNNDGSINVSSLAGAVRKAIKESPGRATHGYTATNAFYIVDDDIVSWDKHRTLTPAQKKRAIPAHSHGSNNWEEFEKRTGQPEMFSPHNSEDVRIWLKGIMAGHMSTASVLIMPDGRMEVLEVKPETNPAIFKMGSKKLASLVESVYGEAGDWLKANPGKETVDFEREKIGKFAKKYGLGYYVSDWRK